MNNKIVLWIWICISHFQMKCFAQEYKTDSLLNALKGSKEDTSKIETLIRLSWHLLDMGDYKSAMQYADEEKKLSEKLISKTNDPKYLKVLRNGRNEGYNIKGVINSSQGNYTEAVKNYNVALKIAEETGDKLGYSNTYINIGIANKKQGNYSEALKNYFAAIKIKEEIGDTLGRASANVNIGNIYRHYGNYTEALKWFLAAQKLYEQLDNKKGLATSYVNIGSIYDSQENNSEAMKNYFSALKKYKEIGNKNGIAICYGNIGADFANMANYDESLKNHLLELSIKKEIGDKEGIAFAYNNIGDCYRNKGNYNEALKKNFASLKIREEIGDKEGIANCYLNIGSVYGETGKYSEAINNLNKSLHLATDLGSKDIVKENYEALSWVYEKMNDFKNAILFHKLYSQMKDTLLNEANSKLITEMKAKYESEKKENEIALLNKDKVIQNTEIKKQKLLKNSFIGGFGLVLILAFVGYRTYRTRQLLKLQTLRNKIASDLHDDVGSTLSSISIFSEIAKEQSNEVSPMLEQIGDSSRKMLDAMADIVWTINPENDQFEKIILRMKSFAYELLGAKKIDFEFDADANVSKMKLPMDVRKNVYLIFKEATNNMVKYAQANKASFAISGNKNNLTMLLRDNGKGFDLNKLTQGNGLINMKRRSEEIGAKLLIESELGIGTTIQLLLNLA